MRRSSLATALTVALLATAAAAQEGPRPLGEPGATEPPDVVVEGPDPAPPTVIAVPGVVVPARPASLWTVNLDLGAYYDSNLRFTDNELETFSERLSLGLTHAKRSGRGTMALSANTWGSVYNGESGLNSVNFSGATSGTYELAPRTRFRGGLSAASTYSPESSMLAGEGLLLPLSRAFTLSGTGGLVQRLGARTSAGIDARYDRVSFSDVEGGLTGLPGGDLILLAASIAPQLNARNSLALGYAFQRSTASSSSNNGESQSVSLGWSRVIGARYSFNASAGAARFELLGDRVAPPAWTFRGTAVLDARFRRSNLNARYDRGISPAYGFGRDRLGDVVSVSYGVTASRKVLLSALGTYGLTRDPSDPLFRFVTQSAAATVSIAVTRRLDLSTAYTFRRSSSEGTPDILGHAVGVALGYSREWRP